MADGFPASGFAVTAFDRDLRSEQELGKTQTDAEGFYRIGYTLDQAQASEAGSADLQVKVFAKDGAVIYRHMLPSAGYARRHYGMAFDSRGVLDAGATAKLRAERKVGRDGG